MMRHKAQKLNPNRIKHLSKARVRIKKDGLSSIKYKLLNSTLYNGFTHLFIDIGRYEE